MAVLEQNTAPFRPYARLMTMLGDQLITDKKVAVIELIKNCYDADANYVSVRIDLGTSKETASIEIEDDGCGMSLDTILNVWLRPATPHKENQKRKVKTTPKGRVIQGEKGIGRFAIHKLGAFVEVYTKAKAQNEVKLEMDFRQYEPEQTLDLFANTPTTEKLLEEVENKWSVVDVPEKIMGESGTLIRISNLREDWSQPDFEALYSSIQRMIPPVDETSAQLFGIQVHHDFDIKLYKNGKEYTSGDTVTFKDVIERAQYKVFGSMSEHGVLSFDYVSTSPKRVLSKTIDLFNKEEMAQNGYNLYSINQFDEYHHPEDCGSFYFSFYAFDLKQRDLTILTRDLELFIKSNFVYLLRDGIRVYPYGERGRDWLDLDRLRSTVKAGQFVSYNDLTGFVYISQEKNPNLKDSTNREELMNIKGSRDTFYLLVRAVTEIFNIEMKLDKVKKEMQKKVSFRKASSALEASYKKLQAALEKIDDSDAISTAQAFVDNYNKQMEIMSDRMHTVQDLAGLGMAVEKSSHDALRLLSLLRGNIHTFKKKLNSYADTDLQELLDALDEGLLYVYDNMQMIQPLFKIQRKAITDVSIRDCIGKVLRYFKSDLEDKIDVQIIANDGDFVVRTNTGLILQVLINLLDNAIYWLNTCDNEHRQITFTLDAKRKIMIVSDNGPGVREDIAPAIFEEFISMKSEGRGLGLYIVREILMRIGGTINLAEFDEYRILEGANFVINFESENL